MLPHVPFRLRLSCASCQVSTCHHVRCAARALQHSTCHTRQDVWCVSLASYIYVIYVVPCTLSVKSHTFMSYMSCPTPLVSKGPVPTMPNVLYARYVVTVSAPPSQPQQQIGERPAVRLYTTATLYTARYTYTPSYTFIPLPLPLCTSLDPRYTRNPTPPTSPHAPEQEDAASSVAALCCTLVALWERPGAHAQGLSRAAHTRISLLHRCCIPLARAHA